MEHKHPGWLSVFICRTKSALDQLGTIRFTDSVGNHFSGKQVDDSTNVKLFIIETKVSISFTHTSSGRVTLTVDSHG